LAVDTRQGVPRMTSFAGTLTSASANGTQQTPVKITTRLMEKPLAAPKPRMAPLTDEQRAAILFRLRSQNRDERVAACHDLQRAAPDDDASEIDDELVPLLNDQGLFARWAAVDALKVWATADSIPALIKSLLDPEHSVRWAALDALGALQDERAAEPMARRLDSEDRGFVEPALKKLGPAAEPAVIPSLQDPAWETRMAVCHVLQEVGTRKSIPALEALSKDSNAIVVGAARDAWNAIKQRN